jgi:hypothetical protein
MGSDAITTGLCAGLAGGTTGVLGRGGGAVVVLGAGLGVAAGLGAAGRQPCRASA